MSANDLEQARNMKALPAVAEIKTGTRRAHLPMRRLAPAWSGSGIVRGTYRETIRLLLEPSRS